VIVQVIIKVQSRSKGAEVVQGKCKGGAKQVQRCSRYGCAEVLSEEVQR
jgi:hypothetical protein